MAVSMPTRLKNWEGLTQSSGADVHSMNTEGSSTIAPLMAISSRNQRLAVRG